MIGVSKRFNKSLHQGNDPKSRKIVREYLERNGVIVKDHPNKYGIDLISDDGTLQLELEHRNSWTEEEFNYDTINVPERKAKFLKDGIVHYVILSRDYSAIGIILGEVIKPYIVDDNLVMNSNKYVRENEFFYKIPKEKFIWIKL